MLLRSSLREKKRYIIVKLINNRDSKEKIVSSISKIFGSYGLARYGISVVKITSNYLVIRCSHRYVKDVIAGLVLLQGNFVPKILKVTATLRNARNLLGREL
jgi:RNase P/RNase MRP subunit POP5